ncbi:Protein of unknown function (plasmid) [Magnetospira sp. QH-2]|nr:Protein of unknown function [Magnetospira sp. QH-2]
MKDSLKARGYRYDGQDKVWVLVVAAEGAGDVEVRWLRGLGHEVVGYGAAEQRYLDQLK